MVGYVTKVIVYYCTLTIYNLNIKTNNELTKNFGKYRKGKRTMKIFDEDGNYLGEFIKESIEEVKDNATETISDGSWVLGLIMLLIIFPGWTILGGVIYIIGKLIWWIFKIVINTAWWLIRLLFTLIIYRELPEF